MRKNNQQITISKGWQKEIVVLGLLLTADCLLLPEVMYG